MSDLVFAPAPRTSDFVELGRVGTGRIFKKMILHMGDEFVHPGDPGRKIHVTPELAESLKTNFNQHVCDIVQVPVVDGKNAHTEDPLRNLGEVIDLQTDDKGIYAIIDARKPEMADQLGKTLIGASAMMHLNYMDTKTGEKKGPTLLHVAVTNRPYITDLDGFEEVIAASADQNGEEAVVLSYTQAEGNVMTLEEMLETLKTEHGIDVAALQEASGKPDVPVALSNALGIDTSAAITLDDIAAGVVELSGKVESQQAQITSLTEANDALKLSAAESEVDVLIEEGRILPKQREDMIKLSMSDREMFERLLPENAIVSLSENGVTTHDKRDTGSDEAVVDNYVALAGSVTTGASRH